MARLNTLLALKGTEVWSIGPANSVYQAIEMMALKSIGALTVLSDEGKLIGIISERDYARKVILEGKSSKDTTVSEIMTKNVICVDPTLKVDECMAVMTEKRVRHLPVLHQGELVGMISVGDLVKSIIDEQSTVIDHLERYIKGEVA
ncbi:MAG: CBS domain-containing protein [Gammaproteobacteria bacterium]|jgi:CBS domain-containing protein|nr:CBS domain-containing protein [Gammaproteobacteria bacterium]MBT5202638.1 CBS domain-containing protein [Gammaproteobacteria bacterium]MBT5603898.1 CBS domain-containing protein [Gammaproteobacteria bacterium]MBT6244790.1 CBS domain-containing protein [Gammaproteobacteria bacterium]